MTLTSSRRTIGIDPCPINRLVTPSPTGKIILFLQLCSCFNVSTTLKVLLLLSVEGGGSWVKSGIFVMFDYIFNLAFMNDSFVKSFWMLTFHCRSWIYTWSSQFYCGVYLLCSPWCCSELVSPERKSTAPGWHSSLAGGEQGG